MSASSVPGIAAGFGAEGAFGDGFGDSGAGVGAGCGFSGAEVATGVPGSGVPSARFCTIAEM